MLFNKAGLCLLSIIILILSGCATPQLIPDSARNHNWLLHQEKTGGLMIWELAGRISVQTENEAWSASLYWQQDHDNYKIRIIAAFGRGSVEISGNADSASLLTADKQLLNNDELDQLMQQNLGWDVPVVALSFWIKGLPAPQTETELRIIDDLGRMTDLHQAGWQIKYERYTNIQGNEIPSRISLQRGELKIRLSVNKWELAS